MWNPGDDCDVYLNDPGPDLDRVRQIVQRYEFTDAAHPPDLALLSSVVPQWVAASLSDAEAAQAVAEFAAAGATASVRKGRQGSPLGGPHDVILEAAGVERVKTIKVVRAITGLDIAAAKSLVESCPCTLAHGLDSRKAAQAVIDLRAVGAQARITGVADRAHAAPPPAHPDARPTTIPGSGGPLAQRYCTECGTQRQDGAKFCVSCGTAIA